ncbi:hypothetical protein RvY_04099 [Ramazzottius varieornatus]|uniref:Uncharacterized protein n=1 Tax=Ramazzottius varieornatus TaxID=947166 RepID=A0A1D1UZQ9_RAMVA|nr:hypothetical protein RvY_04099 [Ramazzottius varieornatus]
MCRASFVLVTVFLVAIRQASAVPDTVGLTTPNTPPLLNNMVVTGTDASKVVIVIDGTVNVKAGVAANALLIHKTVADPGVALGGCIKAVGVSTTDLMCQCTSANSTTGTGAAVAPTTSPLMNGAAPIYTATVPVYIWQAFCSAQTNLCGSTAGATACVAAAAAPAAGAAAAANTTAPVAGGGNATTIAPGATTTAKASASTTASKMVALTVAPLAMLAVANLVV